VETTFVSAA